MKKTFKFAKNIYAIISIVIVTLLTIIICLYSIMNNRNIKSHNATEIAKHKYELNKIHFVNKKDNRNSAFRKVSSARPFFYIVLGENIYGEELFIFVPENKFHKTSLIDWPFKNSYKDMIKEVKGKINSIEDNLPIIDPVIEFLEKGESDEIDKDFNSIYEDVNFILKINGWLITEKDEEIIIYGQDFKNKK